MMHKIIEYWPIIVVCLGAIVFVVRLDCSVRGLSRTIKTLVAEIEEKVNETVFDRERSALLRELDTVQIHLNCLDQKIDAIRPANIDPVKVRDPGHEVKD